MKSEEISFPEKLTFIQKNGWKIKSPMALVKNGIEIFFDNSHSYEIYLENDYSKRLFEGRVISKEDLIELLKKLEDYYES